MIEPHVWAGGASMAECGEAHLRALAAALGHDDIGLALRLYGEMTNHWGRAPLAPLAFRSAMTFDYGPLEFSVVLAPGGARLRWGLDCVASDGDPLESRAIGVGLCRRLAAYGADLSRFEAVAGVLAGAPVRSPLMVGVDPFRGAGGPLFKVYFAGGAGPGEGEGACLAALEALGMGGAARFVRGLFEGEGARYFLFALDLTPGAEARVKVYVRCPAENFLAAAGRLAGACGEGPEKVAAVEAFLRTVAGLPAGADVAPAAARVVTTLQFVEGREAPRGFACNYAVSPVTGSGDEVVEHDDGALSRRVVEVLARHGLSGGPYLAALEAVRRVPLGDEYMIHNYVTLQGRPGATSVSVYLNPRFHAYLLEPDEWA